MCAIWSQAPLERNAVSERRYRDSLPQRERVRDGAGHTGSKDGLVCRDSLVTRF
jgi:hypothetical protein